MNNQVRWNIVNEIEHIIAELEELDSSVTKDEDEVLSRVKRNGSTSRYEHRLKVMDDVQSSLNYIRALIEKEHVAQMYRRAMEQRKGLKDDKGRQIITYKAIPSRRTILIVVDDETIEEELRRIRRSGFEPLIELAREHDRILNDTGYLKEDPVRDLCRDDMDLKDKLLQTTRLRHGVDPL